MITLTTTLTKEDATATITVPVETILNRAENLGYPIDKIEDVALVWSTAMWDLNKQIEDCLRRAIERP